MGGPRETLGDPGRHELLRGLERLDDLQSLARCGRAKRVDHAERRKVEGNAAFKARDFDGAILAYLDAIWLLRPAPEPDDMPLASGCVPRGDVAAGLLGPKGEAATMGLGDGRSTARGGPRALRNARALMGLDEDAKASGSLGVLCTKRDLDPAVRREAKALLRELKHRKELGPGQEKSATFPTSKAPISAVFHSLGRASTWSSIMNTTKSVREKEKIANEVKNDPKMAEAQKMMMKMPAPNKVDIQKPQRLNFVSMAKKEWTKKTFYYTAAEVAARKQEKWIRRLHPEDGDPYVFDYDGTKETKKRTRATPS
ncbi:tRNA-Phe hydroxylase [Aureococcus anophagefferens]|nr:tRNA-Phe hydroxylase [Aureococcus anophagefferens]